MKPLIRIEHCIGGLVHLSTGAMPLRLDRRSFEHVAQQQAIQAAAVRLAAAVHCEQPTFAVIQGELR